MEDKIVRYKDYTKDFEGEVSKLAEIAEQYLSKGSFEDPQDWYRAMALCIVAKQTRQQDSVFEKLYDSLSDLYDYSYAHFYLNDEDYTLWFQKTDELNRLFLNSGYYKAYSNQYYHYRMARISHYDLDKTINYLQEGFEKGDLDAKAITGYNIYYGVNKKDKNEEEGIKLLQEAYHAGSDLAGMNLMYIQYFASENTEGKEAVLDKYPGILDKNKGLYLKAFLCLDKGEEARAYELFQRGIKNKSAYSAYCLADQMYRGYFANLGFTPKQAKEYFVLAFEHGQVYAGFLLGQIHWYPKEGEPDNEEAISFHRKAAQYNQPDSQLELARLYFYNQNYLDIAKGNEYLDRALSQDYVYALTEKAYRLLEVEEKKDPQEAKILLERALDKGDGYAAYRLGLGYQDAEFGGERDFKKAYEFYELAAERNEIRGIERAGEYNRFGYGIEVNPGKAIEYYKKGISMDSNYCWVELAMMMEAGEGMEKDVPSAIALYEEALEKGYVYAAIRLGYLYEYEQDLEHDYSRARTYYKQASDAGVYEGIYNYARCLRYEIGGEADIEQAIQLFDKAAENNYTDALVDVALAYETGIGKTKNPEKAYDNMLKAAEAGIVFAQYKVGIYHVYEKIATADLQQGREWLEKAAKNGSVDALIAIGNYYLYDYPQKEEYDPAFGYFQKAAESAVYTEGLGLCHLYGIGTNRDEKKAFDCLKKGADYGNYASWFNLGLCYLNGTGTQKDPIEAFYYFKMAADQDNLNAAQYAGKMMISGEGTEKNTEEGIRLLQKAADADFDVAQYELGNCYLRGVGVTQDDAKAMEWYQKAADNGNKDAQKIVGKKRRRKLW